MTPKRYPSEAVSDTENGMSGKRLSRRSTVRIINFFFLFSLYLKDGKLGSHPEWLKN